MDDAAVHALSSAVAAGDRAAFATFYERFFDMMYREARRATGRDEAFCLDVVHDAMLRVVRKLRPLPSSAALDAWLRRTVVSCAIDRLRADARRRRREHAVAAARGLPATAARDDDVDVRLAGLRRHLGELDADASALLILRHRAGLTLERIGTIVGISGSAADGRIRRVLDKLRHRAAEDEQ